MSTQNLLVPRSFVEAVAERADKDLRYDAQDILAKAPTPVCVTAEMVRELRERTGEGLMSCNKALHAHHGDIEGAIEHLRCEGQLVVRRSGSLQPCGCPVKWPSNAQSAVIRT